MWSEEPRRLPFLMHQRRRCHDGTMTEMRLHRDAYRLFLCGLVGMVRTEWRMRLLPK